MSLNSFIFRKMCTKSDTARDSGLTTPPDIQRFDDIQYGSDPKWNILDVYRPKSAADSLLPVIVSFHGGGWVYGDKEVYQFYCMDLAKRGFAVINYTYRLAPKYRYPAPFEDTNEVFCWLMENAEKYGFDIDNVFAVGDSAGATGIALYACILTSPDYAVRYSFTPPKGLKINGLALNCGIYDTEHFCTVKTIRDYLPKHGSGNVLSDMTVIKHVTKDFPPSYIMTANCDNLRSESPIMEKALRGKGVPYRYKEYGSDDCKLYHVFHCNIKTAEAAQANDDECAFFRELIR
ncbi:MAG: alpha/beta hydrolase [Ruminococcus sp.]|nr:alpha/beta hydrolase [Ruminococcus sp.]